MIVNKILISIFNNFILLFRVNSFTMTHRLQKRCRILNVLITQPYTTTAYRIYTLPIWTGVLRPRPALSHRHLGAPGYQFTMTITQETATLVALPYLVIIQYRIPKLTHHHLHQMPCRRRCIQRQPSPNHHTLKGDNSPLLLLAGITTKPLMR